MEWFSQMMNGTNAAPFGFGAPSMANPTLSPPQISPIEQNQNLVKGLYGAAYQMNRKKKHGFPMPHPMMMQMLGSYMNQPTPPAGGMSAYYNDFRG